MIYSVKVIGLETGIAMMETTMKIVNLTVGIAATRLISIGINIATFVNVIMKMMSRIVSTQVLVMGYVMLKTTMLIATLMVEIAVAQLSIQPQLRLLMSAVVRFSRLKTSKE